MAQSFCLLFLAPLFTLFPPHVFTLVFTVGAFLTSGCACCHGLRWTQLGTGRRVCMGGGGSVRGVSTDRDPLGVICRDVFQIIHSIVI